MVRTKWVSMGDEGPFGEQWGHSVTNDVINLIPIRTIKKESKKLGYKVCINATGSDYLDASKAKSIRRFKTKKEGITYIGKLMASHPNGIKNNWKKKW